MVIYNFTNTWASDWRPCCKSKTLHPLIFTSGPECFNQHTSVKNKLKAAAESQQTNLSVGIVQHGNQSRDAFQTTHIRFDLENRPKGNGYYKNFRASEEQKNTASVKNEDGRVALRDKPQHSISLCPWS